MGGRAAQRRRRDAGRADCAGESIELGPIDGRGARLELVAPYASSGRLLLARLHSDDGETVPELLWRLGEPIRYGYVAQRWPLGAYQNVYATTPGSAEMPSAGRPFTTELITALVARGIAVAPICSAHRRLLARAPRAAVPRALSRSPTHTARADRRHHGPPAGG